MCRSTDTIADAVWGIGVYFTDMDPNNFRAYQIAFNNWLQPLSSAIRRKLEYCIVVTFWISDLYEHRVIKTNFGTNNSYQAYY